MKYRAFISLVCLVSALEMISVPATAAENRAFENRTSSNSVTGAAPYSNLVKPAAIKCTCRFNGKDYLEGQFACIKTSSGMRMAQCSKYLNNSSWTFTKLPCPTS